MPDPTIGFPFHGWTDGILRLPNSEIIDYPTIDWGSTLVVRNPSAPGISRTEEEQARDTELGYQWRDYGLLSGYDRNIGGQDIGRGKWIYCDSAGTAWLIRSVVTTLYDPALKISIKIYLESLFGRFGRKDRQPIDRLLADGIYAPDDMTDGASPPGFNFHSLANSILGTAPSESGAGCFFNVYSTNADPNINGSFVFALGSMSDEPGNDIGAVLNSVYKVTLTGAGSLDDQILGVGINASLVKDAAFTDLNYYEESTTGGGVPTSRHAMSPSGSSWGESINFLGMVGFGFCYETWIFTNTREIDTDETYHWDHTRNTLATYAHIYVNETESLIKYYYEFIDSKDATVFESGYWERIEEYTYEYIPGENPPWTSFCNQIDYQIEESGSLNGTFNYTDATTKRSTITFGLRTIVDEYVDEWQRNRTATYPPSDDYLPNDGSDVTYSETGDEALAWIKFLTNNAALEVRSASLTIMGTYNHNQLLTGMDVPVATYQPIDGEFKITYVEGAKVCYV